VRFSAEVYEILVVEGFPLFPFLPQQLSIRALGFASTALDLSDCTSQGLQTVRDLSGNWRSSGIYWQIDNLIGTLPFFSVCRSLILSFSLSEGREGVPP